MVQSRQILDTVFIRYLNRDIDMLWKTEYKLWWKDKEAIKNQIIYGLPITILSAIFYYLTVFDTVNLIEYILLVGALSIFVFSFFDYLLKLPNGFIGKNSKNTNNHIRLYLFIVGTVLAYLISIPILANHYSFFEKFIGTQFLIEHFGFSSKS